MELVPSTSECREERKELRCGGWIVVINRVVDVCLAVDVI